MTHIKKNPHTYPIKTGEMFILAGNYSKNSLLVQSFYTFIIHYNGGSKAPTVRAFYIAGIKDGSEKKDISANIQETNLDLNNLTETGVDKIMNGTIFDVFTVELKSSDYNTDLKKKVF